MIRILIFIAIVFALTLGATQLIGVEGDAVIQFGSTVLSGSSSAFVFVALLLFAIVIFGTLFISGLFQVPKTIARRHKDKRREKGLNALTRGLEAVAAGDAADAQRHAKMAGRQLKDQTGLTRLLTAQAAQMIGDELTAEQSFAAMLEAPETEFLGLRGLYLQALKSGDKKEAREFAERAFRLRPGTEWAYHSVYTLHIERGAWGDARDALAKAQQHGLEHGESAKRREAALLTAMAYAADTGSDADTARREANEALRKAPGFAPAAVLAARLEGNAGRRSKAGKLLDETWAIAPHPAIAKALSDLYSTENLERKAERLKKLAEKNPDTDESLLLIAEQEIALSQYSEACERLEPLLTRAPRARTFSAMADATRGLYGDSAAQVWLDRAAASPLDPVPGADGDFHFTTDGWKRLIREYGDHGRMAPPPLEELRTSLTVEEVRLLLVPPISEQATTPEATAPDSDVAGGVITSSSTEDVAAEGDPVEDQQTLAEADPAEDNPAVAINETSSTEKPASDETPTGSSDDNKLSA